MNTLGFIKIQINYQKGCLLINLRHVKRDCLFTKKEIEILKFLAKGYDSTSIAEALTISYNTISAHINNMYTKADLNLKDINTGCLRVQLIRIALRQNVITLEEMLEDNL